MDSKAAGGADDRPTAETRWICLAVAAILLAAVLLLYARPGDTDELFAWTIAPEMTPLFMGAAYGAGVYFFTRGFTAERWHRISAGFLPIALFAALMLIATLIHFDKFNGGDGPTMAVASFYAWTIVYAVSPFVVAGVWLRNRGSDDGTPEPVDATVPRQVRSLARVGGIALAAVGTVLFVSPSVAADICPGS